jgi:hypothetical protein
MLLRLGVGRARARVLPSAGNWTEMRWRCTDSGLSKGTGLVVRRHTDRLLHLPRYEAQSRPARRRLRLGALLLVLPQKRPCFV